MARARGSLGVIAAGLVVLVAAAWWVLRPSPERMNVAAGQEAAESATAGSVRLVPPPPAPAAGAEAAVLPENTPPPPGPVVEAYPLPPELEGIDLTKQTPEQAHAKSWGCIECHKGAHDPHYSKALNIGCCDCHGGNPNASEKMIAHVNPKFADAWLTSGNPIRSYTLLNHEFPEFVRFVNPGDLRVAHISCGTAGCHPKEVLEVRKSMMTHGCMLWGAALYNNGSVPNKWSRFGESYSMHGTPQRLQTYPPPTEDEMKYKGVIPYLDPLPRFQVTQPSNILRIFERGGRFAAETGIPQLGEESGRPRQRSSNRGLGTANRTDPVFISLAKTRLLNPMLSMLGTNDHPGDYRSSGCTACHVIYANDRSPVHSGPYAKYGNRGTAAAQTDAIVANVDPTIPTDEPGHPIQHQFTTAIPTSQCIICHTHPGTNVLNSYLGYMWWDLETDGQHMYPAREKHPTSEQYTQAAMSDPNSATARGLWSDPEFLANVVSLNPYLRHTQFADFHPRGWIFKAVYKKDVDGTLLDYRGERIENPTNEQLQLAILIPQYVKQLYQNRDQQSAEALRQKEAELERLRQNVPVHMLDIHLEKGMHCIDCHFLQDNHGNGKLYGEVRAAIEIRCIDCHGTPDKDATILVEGRRQMRTSGPAATDRPEPYLDGRNLTAMRTPFGKPRFEIRGDKIIQNSLVEKDLSWEVTQVKNTIDPGHADYNPLSAISKTVRLDENGQFAWGDVPDDPSQCAHAWGNMNCVACHSSWNPSCYGCHLPQKADRKMPELIAEGDVTFNYVEYNFQTLRSEVYMLARDGIVTGNMINPARSSCAIHVTSYNRNRESIYVQQQTISGEGFSGIAFSTNVPHTVRGKGETKMCADCHIAETNDNNAQMAQLLMHGTNFMNFMGRYCWMAAGEEGLWAVEVTERDDPQTVIGSFLHKLAYSERYNEHLEHGRELQHAFEHPGNDISDNIFYPHKKAKIYRVYPRGEFLYAACGELGLRIFDIAFIDNKAFSERMTTAPVSPLGQRLYIRTKYCTDVVAPTTLAPDPTRKHFPENMEGTIHPMYGNIYVTDKYEGLIIVGVATLLDGDPTNNFVKRAVTFNPDGMLKGARKIEIFGTYAYICCDAGLVVVSLEDPENPYVTCVIGEEFLHEPEGIAFQFRYGFVVDKDGLKIIDTTDPAQPKPLEICLPLPEAKSIFVARTYAYIAGGEHGMIIVDVKNPEQPKVDQIFTGDGCLNDVHDIKLAITYVSEFAYVADGKNGLRVVQLTSPETPGNLGFSPRPTPVLVATFPFPHGGEALSVQEALDRDRAVDESGNQIAVFGRVGARPLTLEEQRRLYMRPDGSIWKVWNPLRDWSITDPRQRELKLHQDVEHLYGPSLSPQRPHAAAPSVTRVPAAATQR